MNNQIKELAEQAGWMMSDEVEGFNTRLEKFAELIVKECIHKMLNTDEQKFVVETEGWELGGANHNAWDRGILDAVATVKEHFGVEE